MITDKCENLFASGLFCFKHSEGRGSAGRKIGNSLFLFQKNQLRFRKQGIGKICFRRVNIFPKRRTKISDRIIGRFILASVISVLLAGAVIFSLLLIKITKISCRSQYGICSKPITDKIVLNIPINYKKAKKQLSGILKGLPAVKEFNISYRFPREITVQIIENKAIYAIKTTNRFYLIGRNGIILDTTNQTLLPYLQAGDFSQTGNVSDKMLFSLELLETLNRLYQVDYGVFSENNVNFRLTDGPMLVFPTQGQKNVLVGALIYILNEIKASPDKMRIEKDFNQATIDLRFKNPVIK